MKVKFLILPFLVILNLRAVFSAPGDVSFIISTTEQPKEGKEGVTTDIEDVYLVPVIYEMDVHSNVTNRYAKTVITNRVKNPAKSAKQTTFSVVLPEKAFISEFVMEIGWNKYQAYVREKEEAKKIYTKAVESGQSAAHVAISTKDSNTFTVSVNVGAEEKATFYLTYEELLERKNNQYDLVLNIRPGQIVDHLNVQVYINESRPLVFVKTPSLRSGNEIAKNSDKLDPASFVEIINSTSALVKFQPDVVKQQEYAKELGGIELNGLAAQFIVQYEVERDPQGGEVLLQDGYFVHFFVPKDAEVIPKHVYFILDTSSSMYGNKLQQVKDAMTSILEEIKPEDSLSIVEFNSEIYVWDIDNEKSVLAQWDNYREPFEQLGKLNLPGPVSATKEAIEKAKKLVENMQAGGGTHMIGGLDAGLYLVKSEIERTKESNDHRQPLIIFLTDGQPNIGLHSTIEIIDVVTKLNENIKTPLYTLAFGESADENFLRKLSLKNKAFSRQIYESADAAIQLQQFYRQISSPLLSNVHFKYNDDASEVTNTGFPILYAGGEIVVTGRFVGNSFDPAISAVGKRGPLIYRPRVHKPVNSLERLWAYLTVRETLEKMKIAKDKTELTKKALKLALKYSFVTEVTSLVVVKPNSTRPIYADDGYLRSEGQEYSTPAFHAYGRGGRPAGGQHKVAYSAVSSSSFVSNRESVVHVQQIPRPRRPRVQTTTHKPTPLPTPTETSKNATLEDSLKWLSAALSEKKTLTVPSGELKLGDDSLKIAATETCPKTPEGKEGVCSLIKDCPQVFPQLADFEVYKTFSCVMQKEYSGVCCPKKAEVAA
ncbi:inter-alpha-trypsin inhibitor heavy chain H3 [Diabrotica virgifera virgifera]|uniref:Inter-alpha-trypsin inhibitor heavy chain H3-like n=1 Tax=Diabrotica virgifera virgifera TaxID=50390 RepID=A0A6P7FC69_DIAVI|nr:inter-alpha-trypsin inhibitor heavy chain H3 [Diabrotica virgifera virgifera]